MAVGSLAVIGYHDGPFRSEDRDMTEEEWLNCTDPTPMLLYLREVHTSERKLRLLACACCRRIWKLLPDPRSRQAVEVAERYADGQASAYDLGLARARALQAAGGKAQQPAWAAYWAANTKAGGPLDNAFSAAAAGLSRQAAQEARSDQAAAWHAMQATSVREQVLLLREVIGNPFRPVVIEAQWLTWAGGTVVQLAEGIYEDRAFDRMPVLGDALEEAGCTNEHILGHCRQLPTSGVEHVRGCWLVDTILARQ
jgi:hypothetical protein